MKTNDNKGTYILWVRQFNGRFKAFTIKTAYIVLVFVALLAFEIFNLSTTEYALKDIWGNAGVLSLAFATIVAVIFCAIDFAPISRLLFPEAKRKANAWFYVFCAWCLGIGMNAALTHHAITVAIANHVSAGSVFVNQSLITRFVPIFVTIMVVLIRAIIIGTLSVAGEALIRTDTDLSTRR